MNLEKKSHETKKSSFNHDKFIQSYAKVIQSKREQVNSLKQKYDKVQTELIGLQEKYGNLYKKAIVLHYMTLWDKSGKFPLDNELTKVIFHLAGLNVSDLNLDNCSNTIPKNKLEFDSLQNRFRFYYFNERLNNWIEIKP